MLIDAEKHVREKERLNQALSGKLSEVQSEMEQFFGNMPWMRCLV